MIRQVTTALKKHYQEQKYAGGNYHRISNSPNSHQYNSQIFTRTVNSPSSRSTSHVTLRRHYRSNVPILKPANWRLFHELRDVHQLMQHLKQQKLYLQAINNLLKTITRNLHNHAQTPSLVLSYFGKPCAIRAIERTPTIPIAPRSEHFNPLQIVVGTLVARKCIHPESNQIYEQEIQRAKLTPNALCDDNLNTYGASRLNIPIKDIRYEEYKRHYKLDPDHWYMYWPKDRHTNQAKKSAVTRFIYKISENEHWCLPTEIYQKQGPGTWTLAPPPTSTNLVDHELREREFLANSLYKEFFQLTH
jgi:hypothetical protein